MSERIMVECDCDPEYRSALCMKCGGTGMKPVPVPELTKGIVQFPLQLDQMGKVYIHLGKEELDSVAKAVYDYFIKERNEHNAVSNRM